MRVLLVDDNVDLLSSLALVLESAGYEVEPASSVAQALDAHQKRAADLLITDIFMPDTDGLEAIAAFRAVSPGLRIIAMSGGGQVAKGNYLDTAEVVGADAVLRKPFDPARLLGLVATLRAGR